MWDAADIVVNMSGISKESTFTDYAKVEDWDVQDPYGTDPVLYQTIYEDIRRRVAQLAERLRNGAANKSAKSGGEVIEDRGK